MMLWTGHWQRILVWPVGFPPLSTPWTLRGQRNPFSKSKVTCASATSTRGVLPILSVEMRYLNGCYSWRVKWLHQFRPDGIDSSPMKSDWWKKSRITWNLKHPQPPIGTCGQLNLVEMCRVCYISGGAIATALVVPCSYLIYLYSWWYSDKCPMMKARCFQPNRSDFQLTFTVGFMPLWQLTSSDEWCNCPSPAA